MEGKRKRAGPVSQHYNISRLHVCLQTTSLVYVKGVSKQQLIWMVVVVEFDK